MTNRSLRSRKSKVLGLTAMGAIVLVAVALRVFALDQQGYWHDEIYSVAHLTGFDAYVLPSSDLDAVEAPRPVGDWREELKRDRFWQTLDRNLVHEGHPPLYQLGLKGWTSLFGRSPRAVRSFSLVPALLTIPVLYLIGLRLRGPKLAAAAAALISASPFHLYYSAEARNYAWALFFSALALLAIVGLWPQKRVGLDRWTAAWCVGVVGSCYTHYYAGLFCAVLLAIYLSVRRRRLGAALKLGLPFLLFVPWLPVLRAQIGVHSADHWTVGAPGALEAAGGFADGVIDQLTGVFGSATLAERLSAAAAVVTGSVLVARDLVTGSRNADVRWVFLSVPVFGIAVLGVDLVTNHHTILVSRYLISMLPCLLLLCAWLVVPGHRALQALFALLIAGNLIGSVHTATGQRAPKQMLREAGAYIADRYETGDTVLVTPSGPSLVGLAHYLPPDVLLGAAPPDDAVATARRMSAQDRTVWLARQNLGVESELQVQAHPELREARVRFVGIDIIPVSSASEQTP